jgi:Arc/MetJ-type ribon-helix-helix transcriptional regulator
MTIRLNPEAERLVGQAIQAGLIGNADDVLSIGVEAIRQRLQSRAGAGSELETEQWLREFTAWVHSHSTTTPLLSDEAISRDSIYGARGL